VSPYLRPTAPIAETVLLPADPGLAMALATSLMTKPLMANHHHGLWGYSGHTDAGAHLTVQSSGIGAPSAVAVLRELHAHGAARVVRIGRCSALDPALGAGATVVATSAIGADGISVALGAPTCRPDADLTDRLVAAARPAVAAPVASHDLGATASGAERDRWRDAGAVAVDLESAAVLASSATLGLTAAVGLVVDPPDASADEGVEAKLLALGEAAATVLAGELDGARR